MRSIEEKNPKGNKRSNDFIDDLYESRTLKIVTITATTMITIFLLGKAMRIIGTAVNEGRFLVNAIKGK